MSRRAKEFDLTRAQFQRIRQMIRDYAGISLAASKQDMVYSRLVRRLRRLRLDSFDAYLALVDGDERNEREAFVNALTTNLTAFYREAHHFEVLDRVLSEYGSQRVRIWCSAASTGEEPYSIAMTAVEHYESWTPPVEIVATDINTEVLAHCRAGIYALDRVEDVTLARRKRFFQRGVGAMAGRARVRPELRRLVEFETFNLLGQQWARFNGVDIIFCRNVMIYFDKPTQSALLQQFHRSLRSGGWLFVGHSESQVRDVPGFVSQGHTVYRAQAVGVAA
ncbi:MAG: CheR family methyltransferase [Pseudomonadota bacterium]|nr:CheR family methyltransferase [Pseudomonadota bacterium]